VFYDTNESTLRHTDFSVQPRAQRDGISHDRLRTPVCRDEEKRRDIPKQIKRDIRMAGVEREEHLGLCEVASEDVVRHELKQLLVGAKSAAEEADIVVRVRARYSHHT